MHKLLIIEWKKILFSKKQFIVIFVCLFLIFAVIAVNEYNYFIEDKFELENYLQLSEGLQEQVDTLNAELGRYEKSREVKIKKLIDLFESEKVVAENHSAAIQENDFDKRLESAIKEKEISIYAHEKNLLIGSPISDLRNELAFLQYIQNTQINPKYVYKTNGLHIVYLLFSRIFPLLLPILSLFFTYDSVSQEQSNGTLKLLLQQPYSRKKILFSKFLMNTFISLAIAFFTIFLTFSIASLLGGVGDPRYPIFVEESAKNAFLLGKNHYVLLSDILTQSAITIVFTIVFFSALGIFISTVSKNTFASLSITIIFVAALIFIRSQNHPYFIHEIETFITKNPLMLLTLFLYLLFSFLLFLLSAYIFERKNVYS